MSEVGNKKSNEDVHEEGGKQVKQINMKKILVVTAVVLTALIVFFATADGRKYSKAMDLKQAGEYAEAKQMFVELEDYKDSVKQKEECDIAIKYEKAVSYMNNNKYETAVKYFADIKASGYKDSVELYYECIYKIACGYIERNKYDVAAEQLSKLMKEMDGEYKNSAELYNECQYQIGVQYLEEKDYENAVLCLQKIEYKDSVELVDKIVNGEYSLNSFIERYNKMTEILQEKEGVSIKKISLENVDDETKTITTSIGAVVRLNQFTEDKQNYKYEINSFLWIKKAWVFVDAELLTADMCCLAAGLLPGKTYEEIINNLVQVTENSGGMYGSAEIDGFKYVIAKTQPEVNFSMTPLE